MYCRLRQKRLRGPKSVLRVALAARNTPSGARCAKTQNSDPNVAAVPLNGFGKLLHSSFILLILLLYCCCCCIECYPFFSAHPMAGVTPHRSRRPGRICPRGDCFGQPRRNGGDCWHHVPGLRGNLGAVLRKRLCGQGERRHSPSH